METKVEEEKEEEEEGYFLFIRLFSSFHKQESEPAAQQTHTHAQENTCTRFISPLISSLEAVCAPIPPPPSPFALVHLLAVI